MFFLGPIRIGNMAPEAAYDRGYRLFNEKKSSAFHYLKYAAEQGHAKAQYGLGSCYKNGLGCREDLRKTLYWYEKAAQQGYYRAQYETAQIYELGKGVPVDKKKALYWYEMAADSGTPEDWCYSVVLYACALFYEEGRGCEVDLHKAILWRLRHLDVIDAQRQDAVKKGREQSIELALDALVRDMETIHRLRSQLGKASDHELKFIYDLHLERARELERDIADRLDKGNCRPIDIPVDNLVKHLECLRQIMIQLGEMDTKAQLTCDGLDRLFDAVRAELGAEMTFHGTSTKANDLYRQTKALYKKIRFYIHMDYIPQAIRDLLLAQD